MNTTDDQNTKITLSKQRSPCPVSSTLDLIGDKWTLVVVRDLFLGCQHYKEFLNRPEKIATNILADRLNKLVESGLVEKSRSTVIAGRDRYSLTALGQSLGPVITSIKEWGLNHINDTETKLKA